MFRSLLLVATMVAVSGCASIINEKNYKINIASNKKKIEGTIDGNTFQGPGIVSVPRGKDDRIMKITTPGCEQEILLRSKIDGVFWVNILSGGVIGSSTDFSNEKMWRYQDQITVNCAK